MSHSSKTLRKLFVRPVFRSDCLVEVAFGPRNAIRRENGIRLLEWVLSSNKEFEMDSFSEQLFQAQTLAV